MILSNLGQSFETAADATGASATAAIVRTNLAQDTRKTGSSGFWTFAAVAGTGALLLWLSSRQQYPKRRDAIDELISLRPQRTTR